VYRANEADGTRKETWQIFHETGLEERVPDNG
jgi:hypothetical protein